MRASPWALSSFHLVYQWSQALTPFLRSFMDRPSPNFLVAFVYCGYICMSTQATVHMLTTPRGYSHLPPCMSRDSVRASGLVTSAFFHWASSSSHSQILYKNLFSTTFLSPTRPDGSSAWQSPLLTCFHAAQSAKTWKLSSSLPLTVSKKQQAHLISIAALGPPPFLYITSCSLFFSHSPCECPLCIPLACWLHSVGCIPQRELNPLCRVFANFLTSGHLIKPSLSFPWSVHLVPTPTTIPAVTDYFCSNHEPDQPFLSQVAFINYFFHSSEKSNW